MSNFKRVSKKYGIAMFFMALLCSCALALPAFAVSAEKGNFIILGNAIDKDEPVALWAQPGTSDIKLGKAESGTQACVLDKIEAGSGIFYFIKTVSGEIGLMGWVSEDYIYQITDAPVI